MTRNRTGGLSKVMQSEDSDSDFEEHKRARTNLHTPDAMDTTSSDSNHIEDPNSSDHEEIKEALFKQYHYEKAKLQNLKMEGVKPLMRNVNNTIDPQYSKDAFTRFSVTSFSNVLDTLDETQRTAIRKFGFGSLLHFDKCYVPNKFAKWLARQVNWKSGDIILKGKVIPLIVESVHLILGLPMGGAPFPSNYHAGKSMILSKFDKMTIPPAQFFASRLIDKVPMSEEDVVICFMLVAMNSFLCTNASVNPSSKYLGVFEDIGQAKEFDWCKYVLEWLLVKVKEFISGKGKVGLPLKTLAGCLYYLAVLYLDSVDFGPRQVLGGIPRISMWKGQMISSYSELDMVSPRQYGNLPILDVSNTYVAKYASYVSHNESPRSSYSDFKNEIESYWSCKLPENLKDAICNLVDTHSFNSKLSINLDVSGISSLPDSMKASFGKLLNHASSVDSRTKELVLDLLKLVVDFTNISNEEVNTSKEMDGFTTSGCTTSSVQDSTNVEKVAVAKEPIPMSNASEYAVIREMSNMPSKPNTTSVGPKSDELHAFASNPLRPKVLKKEGGADVLSTKIKEKAHIWINHVSETENVPIRPPLSNISNNQMLPLFSKNFKPAFNVPHDCVERDVIFLDEENEYVPDSMSPSPSYGIPRYCSQKLQNKPNLPVRCPDRSNLGPIPMQPLDLTEDNCETITPRLFKEHQIFSTKRKVPMNHLNSPVEKESQEIMFIDEKTLAKNSIEVSKQVELLYNSKLSSSELSSKKGEESGVNLAQHAHGSSSNPVLLDGECGFVAINSSSGGKPASQHFIGDGCSGLLFCRDDSKLSRCNSIF